MTRDGRTRIAIATAPNLRDLGGWPTTDGRRIRPGQVYRSAELSRLHGEDLAAFDALDVGTVFDLRTAAEVAGQPDALPEGTRYVTLDVLADARRAAPAELQRIFEDPSTANEYLREGQAERYFESAYRGFVTLPSARRSYGALLEALATADSPVLYHCTTGKDRTGWATAVLFLLCGVPEDAVWEEYLLTNTELLPAVQPWLDQFAAAGGDPALLMPVVGVQESYLGSALEEMQASYGSLEGYASEALGLSEETVQALRERLVEP